MAKIPFYTAILKSALAGGDQFVLDHSDVTKSVTITELNKQWIPTDNIVDDLVSTDNVKPVYLLPTISIKNIGYDFELSYGLNGGRTSVLIFLIKFGI